MPRKSADSDQNKIADRVWGRGEGMGSGLHCLSDTSLSTKMGIYFHVSTSLRWAINEPFLTF